MRMVDLIEKKKLNLPLSHEEISFVVKGYTGGTIPDYQMSAFLMAVYFNGMTPEETADLTMEMANSGEICVMSPAAASYGIFKNFEERGDVFKKLVLEA